jgi:hypothetical protein
VSRSHVSRLWGVKRYAGWKGELLFAGSHFECAYWMFLNYQQIDGHVIRLAPLKVRLLTA